MSCTPGSAKNACEQFASTAVPTAALRAAPVLFDRLPAEMKPLARSLLRYPSRAEAVAALAADIEDLYRLYQAAAVNYARAKARGAFSAGDCRGQMLDLRRQITERLMDQMGYPLPSEGDGGPYPGQDDWFDAYFDLWSDLNSVCGLALDRAGNTAGEMPPAAVVDEILNRIPAPYQGLAFTLEGEINLAFDPDSREGVAARLRYGQPVPPSLLLRYPDLIQEFGL